jgi:hypothetical protein
MCGGIPGLFRGFGLAVSFSDSFFFYHPLPSSSVYPRHHLIEAFPNLTLLISGTHYPSLSPLAFPLLFKSCL